MYGPTLTYAETTEGQMTLTPGHPEHNNDHVSSFLRGAASCGDFGGASRSAGYNRKSSSSTDRRRHRLGDSEDVEDDIDDDDEYDNDDDDGSSFDEARYDRRGSRSRLSTLADETREGAPTALTADSFNTRNDSPRNGHRNGGEQDFDADPTELFAALHSRNWTVASAALRRDPDQASVWIYRLDDDDEAKSAAKGNDNGDNDNASAVEPLLR